MATKKPNPFAKGGMKGKDTKGKPAGKGAPAKKGMDSKKGSMPPFMKTKGKY